jgi:endonuclease/exonuclease/phosphatase (EEP) superfamily protein YafD
MPLYRRALPELPALAAPIGRTPGSRIVIGDMNTTDGSPLFSDFVLATGLRDSRLGFGRQPSWPTFSPYRIALEHAFVSDDLAVVARRLGPSIGSDHLPLIIDLAPAAGSLEDTKRASHSGAEPGRGG